jgi:hypothetical protein
LPVQIQRLDLGTPPTRTVTRGSLAGQQVPRYEVILPGWSDIIRVTPTSSLTPAEVAVERQRRNAQLNRSPSPDVIQNLSKLGQEIDNVQDALVTLSLAGRIATKLLGRVIPGVGLIATAADLLNLVNVFYPNTLAGSVAGAATRAGQKITGRSKYLGNKAIKRALGLAPDASLSTYLRRLEETIKTGKVNVGLGELLQVAQTSEQMTGYGLALGPIFGALQDTFFGLLRGARFDLSGPLSLTSPAESGPQLDYMRRFAPAQYDMIRGRADELQRQQGLPVSVDPNDVARILARNPVRVQVDFPGIIPSVDILRGAAPGTTEADLTAVLGPMTYVLNRGALGALREIGEVKKATVAAATSVWNGVKWLVGVRGDLPWDVHIEITCAQILAMQELLPLMDAVDWSIPVVGGDLGEQDSLPFCPRSHDHPRDVGSVSYCLAKGPARFPFDWVDQAPSAIAREFSVALIDAAADLVPLFLEGPHVKVELDNGPFWKAFRLMHEYNLLPPFLRDDQEVLHFGAAVAAAIAASVDALPSFQLVRSLWLESFPGGDPD